MNFKTYTSLIVISFISGYSMCFYILKPHKIYENKTQSDVKSSEISKTTSDLSNSRVINRTYNKGQLEKEIITEFEHKSEIATKNVNTIQKINVTEQKFAPESKKDWILGVSAPLETKPSLESVSIQIGHRFIGNTYLYVSTDSKLKTTAGVIFSF